MSAKAPGKSGTLWVVAGLLAASAALRLSGETGQAIAREMAPLAADMAEKADGGAKAHNEDVEISSLLASLRKRSSELDARERQLEDWERALEISNQEVDEKLAALIDAEENLRETLALADGASEEDLARLTSVYEAMKPKEAAPLFEEMTPDFAAGFLGRMRPDAAAKIMASMDASAAYAVSVILAGRNATVPKE